MPMSLCRKAVVLAAASVSMLAIAADQPFDIRPGEWNFTVDIKLGAGTHTTTDTSCLTADDIRAVRVLQIGPARNRSCTAQVTHRSSRLIEGVLQCRDAARSTRIEVRLEASSPTRFSGTMHAAGTDGTADLKLTAEWVAADCQDIDADGGDDWDED